MPANSVVVPRREYAPVVLNLMLACGLGGLEQAAFDYHQLLQIAGYRPVSVIQPQAKMRQLFAQAGLEYELLNNWGMYDFFSKWQLTKIIRRYRPVCIITHGSRAAYMTQQARYSDKQPIIAVSHNYKYKRLLESDYIVALTKDMQTAIASESYTYEKIIVIPDAVKPAPVAAVKARDEKVWPERPIIGAMGRFEEEKGYDLLIQALAVLHSSGIECRLVLAGAGSKEKELRSLAQELAVSQWVDFVGWVSGAQKQKFLSNCDVFCVPSRRETFGISMIEAFSYKIPVVASKTQGPMQIAQHGQVMELVDVDDPQALASGLQRMLQDRNYRGKTAESGYNLVQEKYTQSAVAAGLKDFLSRVIVRS
ncbi:MAG: glycosyltransferase family 4 protein [Proteobacteria bacterium]|nr:glycosyltransferase family 4 protein [Pseudomonadota bacterium]